MYFSFPRLWPTAVAACTAAALFVAACDTAPGPVSLDRQPPEVDSLIVVPDTIRVAALPTDSITDGQATVRITTAVTARDSDGVIDRVFVYVEPAYGTTPSVVGQLPRVAGHRFGGTGRYAITIDRADVLMVRAFAVDNDSLTSNQVIGQIRVLPDTTSGAD